tara:strand:+ start:596 stop:1438 length:843 start_codon:yes stop_codon:yes gene_type:complete
MINEYHFDKLIIGGSIESLLYSYFTNTNILILKPLYPFELLTYEYSSPFRLLGYSDDEIIRKSELWDRLTFLLSMTGLISFPNILNSYREQDDKIILITEQNKRIIVSFDELLLFDDISDEHYIVYDWFIVRSGNNHNYEVLVDKQHDFVNKVHFYRAARIGGNKQMKDLVSESKMTSQGLSDINQAEGIARLKTIQMMSQGGIRGQSNGKGKNGINNHYAIKIEHTHRDIRAIYKPNVPSHEILDFNITQEDQWKFTKKLFRHKIITTLQESFRLPASL